MMQWVIRIRLSGKYLFGFNEDGSAIITSERHCAWRFPTRDEACATLAHSVIAGVAFVAPMIG